MDTESKLMTAAAVHLAEQPAEPPAEVLFPATSSAAGRLFIRMMCLQVEGEE
jgi:hypothetical protein